MKAAIGRLFQFEISAKRLSEAEFIMCGSDAPDGFLRRSDADHNFTGQKYAGG